MTQHHFSIEELSSYLDGQVGPTQRLTMERHLEGCPICRGELEGLQLTVGLLRRVPLAEPRRQFTLEPAYGRARRPLPWLQWATGLAALLLVAVVSLDVTASLGVVSLAPSSPQGAARATQLATPTSAAPSAAQPEPGIAGAPAEDKAPAAPVMPSPTPTLAPSPSPTAAPLATTAPSAQELPSLRLFELALLALVALLGGLALAQGRRRHLT